MKEKVYKCSYKHCKHEPGEITSGSEVKVGNRYMHQDCAKESSIVAEIRNYYYENISNTVVMKNLVSVINNIVYSKGIDANYLLYALRFAFENKIPIKSPYGLHYIIDNSRVKSAWKKKQNIIVEANVKKAVEEASIHFEPSNNSFVYQSGNNKKFGNIFK